MDNNYNNNYGYSNRDYNEPRGRKGLAIAGIITGALSIPLALCTGYVGILFGLLGLLFGIFSKGSLPRHSSAGIAAIITGAVGFVLGIVITASAIYILTHNPDILNQYQDLLDFYNR